jgi:hypothetical protein
MDNLLKTFCGTDELRPTMMAPNLSNDGKFVVATDAHLLIRVPVSRLKETYTNSPKYPNWEAIFPKEVEWNLNDEIKIELLKEILSRFTPIPTYNECEVCNGDGDMECNMGHMHDCLTCDGTGEGSIVTGYEIDSLNYSITIYDIGFNPNYLSRIIEICDAHGTDSFILKRAIPMRSAIFEIKDTHVLIMPLAQSTRNKEKLI